MTAEIIVLSDRRGVVPEAAVVVPPRGGSVQDAMIDIALGLPVNSSVEEAGAWSYWLLSELRVRGFAVVPVEVA